MLTEKLFAHQQVCLPVCLSVCLPVCLSVNRLFCTLQKLQADNMRISQLRFGIKLPEKRTQQLMLYHFVPIFKFICKLYAHI